MNKEKLSFKELLKKDKDRPFKEIQIGNFILSIQAGSNYFSYPMEDGLEPKDYTHFEVAVFDLEKRRVYPKLYLSGILNKLNLYQYFEKIDDKRGATGRNVPDFAIDSLLNELGGEL